MFPVSIDSVDNCALQMDLYMRFEAQEAPVLYRSVGVEFTDDDRLRLREQNHRYLYVPVKQHAVYSRQLVDRLDRLYRDPQTRRQERSRVVRAACQKMIEDLLVFPGQREPVQTVVDIAQQFARWSGEDPAAFEHLVDLSAHDFYTATHMVNVGVGCGVLARAAGITDPQLHAAFIQGGLLHDIGKRNVPQHVLNKEGALEPSEWDAIRQHPELGHNELRDHPGLPAIVLEMALAHHERLDGAGYPRGLSHEQIGVPVRICSIVDVFDAITATRPYRGPTPPLKTLRMMAEALHTQFDERLFEAWRCKVEEIVQRDPSGAVPETTPAALTSLASVFQAQPAVGGPGPARRPGFHFEQEEARRHPRQACDLRLWVRLEHAGKRLPDSARQWLVVRAVDISPGGLQIETRWPLSINDRILIALPQHGGRLIYQRGQIVRVRAANDVWRAGVFFTERSPELPPGSHPPS